jgi:FkbM family methyltransferase
MRRSEMLIALRDSGIAWELRRSYLWKRYRGNPHRKSEQAFYRSLVDGAAPGCILDVGANRGSKTEIFLDLASLVIAVEPDPSAASTLRRRFRSKPVEVLEVAISRRSGTLPFYRFEPGSAFNTLSNDWVAAMTDGSNYMNLRLPEPVSIEVRTDTLSNIIARYLPVKYLKVDAEGFEEDVLSTLNVAIPLVSLEFTLPDMRNAMVACVQLLLQVDPNYRFNVAITEPPLRLELDAWVEGEKLISDLKNRGWRYAELYARTAVRAAKCDSCQG